MDLAYGFDTNRNLFSVSDPNLGNRSMTYDGVNRLYSASGPWGLGSFSYDDNDNLTQKSIGAENLSYTYDPLSNLLTGINDNGSAVYNVSYDVYGNVTSNGANSFAYDDASNVRVSVIE